MNTNETKPRLCELDGPVSGFIANAIPKPILEGLENYVWYGTPTGGFLHAVLTNDLRGAMSHGDLSSLKSIRSIVQYVYNYLPSGIHGNAEKIAAHIKRGQEE